MKHRAANFEIPSEVGIFMTSGHVCIKDSVFSIRKLFAVNLYICKMEFSKMQSTVCFHWGIKGNFPSDFSRN